MNIASYIDHTILKPTTTLADIAQLCREAAEYRFAAVCVPPGYIREAKIQLQETEVKIATVIGFPFGYNSTRSKMEEIKEALADGADELDMVINLTAVKNNDWDTLDKEIESCVSIIHASGKIMKLIVESGILTKDELISCCALVRSHKVDFIKTSTGYAETGATPEAVKTMRAHLPETVSIKASGGIRTFSFAKELIEAGANRIGCSSSVKIVEESNIHS